MCSYSKKVHGSQYQRIFLSYCHDLPRSSESEAANIKNPKKNSQALLFPKKEICFIENVDIDINFHFYEKKFQKNQNLGL